MEELRECPFCKTHLVHEEGRIKHIDPAGIGCVLDGQVWPDRVATEWNTRATDPLMEEMARALEELDDMFDPTSRVGEIINNALQKYREATCQVEKK